MSYLQTQDDSPCLLTLEHETLKACGHNHLWMYEFLGEASASEPGHLHNSPWTNLGGDWSRARSGPSSPSHDTFSGITDEHRRSLYPCIRPLGIGNEGLLHAFHRERESWGAGVRQEGLFLPSSEPGSGVNKPLFTAWKERKSWQSGGGRQAVS